MPNAKNVGNSCSHLWKLCGKVASVFRIEAYEIQDSSVSQCACMKSLVCKVFLPLHVKLEVNTFCNQFCDDVECVFQGKHAQLHRSEGVRGV